MRSAPAGFVIGLAIAIGLACGPRKPPNTIKQNEITALWTQIREWRREAKLPVEPRPEDVPGWVGKTVEQAKLVCPDGHPVPTTCGDVCSLAENICDNAESICILASELGAEDTWAQDKCTSAKASCRDAKKLCCKCSETDSKASIKW
jgi:hypothetical protein